MPSPFPGMDPYIEGWIWPSFHSSMIVCIHDDINPRLPKKYIATIENFIRRVDLSSEDRVLLGPDLYVAGRTPKKRGTALATVRVPHTSVLEGTVVKQRYLKIVDHHARRIVTVIELLSPSNKTIGDDGIAYRHKREEYIGGGINLVEVDLLRRGTRPPFGNPPPPECDYLVAVHRGADRGVFGIWPFSVRERIPEIPVPLDPDVPDVMLDLRKCIDHVYKFGRYDDQLDYRKPPELPLRKSDAKWARELLARKLTPTKAGV